jgi:hypothetical protein
MIRHIWIERQGDLGFDTLHDSTDVLVQMEDGDLWVASFATVSYLHRQMEMSRVVAREMVNMPEVRFVAIETPHVVVDNLNQDTIEDAVDNMMTLGVFETVFVLQQEVMDHTFGRLVPARTS